MLLENPTRTNRSAKKVDTLGLDKAFLFLLLCDISEGKCKRAQPWEVVSSQLFQFWFQVYAFAAPVCHPADSKSFIHQLNTKLQQQLLSVIH